MVTADRASPRPSRRAQGTSARHRPRARIPIAGAAAPNPLARSAVAGRTSGRIGAVFETHQRRHLGSERVVIKLDGFFSAAVEVKVGLNCLNVGGFRGADGFGIKLSFLFLFNPTTNKGTRSGHFQIVLFRGLSFQKSSSAVCSASSFTENSASTVLS